MIKAYLSLTAMIIVWSLSFIVVDYAVESITPMTIALYRFIVASAAFLVIDFYSILRRKKTDKSTENPEKENKITKKGWLLIEFASLTGAVVFYYAQYNAIDLIGPSLPALFVCLLSPVIIAIFALIFFDEKLNSVKIIGFIVATLGGFLLVTGGDITNLMPDSPNFLGYLFAILTPLLWGLYSTLTKMIGEFNSSLKLIKYICYVGTPHLFLIVLFTGELGILFENFFNITVILAGLYLGIACTIIGYYIWQKSQMEMKSSKVASFLYVEPFITLIFSMLLQRSETIVLWNIIGGIIVLVAVLIINYEKKEKKIKI